MTVWLLMAGHCGTVAATPIDRHSTEGTARQTSDWAAADTTAGLSAVSVGEAGGGHARSMLLNLDGSQPAEGKSYAHSNRSDT